VKSPENAPAEAEIIVFLLVCVGLWVEEAVLFFGIPQPFWKRKVVTDVCEVLWETGFSSAFFFAFFLWF